MLPMGVAAYRHPPIILTRSLMFSALKKVGQHQHFNRFDFFTRFYRWSKTGWLLLETMIFQRAKYRTDEISVGGNVLDIINERRGVRENGCRYLALRAVEPVRKQKNKNSFTHQPSHRVDAAWRQLRAIIASEFVDFQPPRRTARKRAESRRPIYPFLLFDS